jgi:hypothetical protein
LKIVQFGLCYSPNLGDGVIADCLAHGLTARLPGAEVAHVDISGRQARGARTIRNRRLVLAMLERLPRPLRHALARRKLNGLIDRVQDSWRAAAAGADLAVIGGGQIFSDANLNFPVKIGRAAGILAERGTPVAVHAVGVSRNWSAEGTALFARVLECDLRMVGTRDAGSATAWAAQMPGGPAPVLTADPGLLAAACYGPKGSASASPTSRCWATTPTDPSRGAGRIRWGSMPDSPQRWPERATGSRCSATVPPRMPRRWTGSPAPPPWPRCGWRGG